MLFDLDLNYDPPRRPVLDALPAFFRIANPPAITGAGFRGGWNEASGGGTASSASNYPLVQLRRLDNEQETWLRLTSFSDTSITSSSAMTTMLPGFAVVTVFVNGIPSESRVVYATDAPGPSIGSIDPASGPLTGGTPVVISGSAFDPFYTTVTIGGAPATSVIVGGADTLTAVTPAGTAGPAEVIVTTPGGIATAPGIFTYLKLAASVGLNALAQTYNGTPRAVTATTAPPGLTVVLTYTGTGGTVYGPSTTPPIKAGSYTVDAVISDPVYQGTQTGTLIVARATPVIAWSNPAPIVYPAALSLAQLNATSGVAGSFVYTPPAGTVLSVGLAQTLSTSFTPGDLINYYPASASVTIDVCSLPSITLHPTSLTWAGGRTARFWAQADGVPAPSIKWQVKALGSAGWADIPGATSTPYGFVTSLADTGKQYRAVFTNEAGSAASDPATLTVIQPAVAGDFNGDGHPDLLWRNVSSGADSLWRMTGGVHTGTTELPAEPSTGWRLVGSGDFDGDGHADLLWHRLATGETRVWLMDGPTFTTTSSLDPEADTNWVPVGSADFNGDGYLDVLWRNVATGANRVWYLDELLATSGAAALDPQSDLHWTVVGTGDVNGDGHPDLIWRNGVTGANTVTFLNGVSTIGTGALPAEPDTTWAIVGVADFDGDRQPDLVWRNVLSRCEPDLVHVGALP